MINDARARVLFVGPEFAGAVEVLRPSLPHLERVIRVGGPGDEYEGWLAAHEPDAAVYPADPGHCFLQLYTSGTTGFPKGSMLTHRGMLAHSQHLSATQSYRTSSRVQVAMPLFHVGGTGYALFGIYAGAPSTFTREPDPASLLAAFAAGATHAFLVPAVVAALLAAGEKAITALSELKYLLYGPRRCRFRCCARPSRCGPG